MRVLVTGAGGFLGRSLVAAALAHGHTVTAMLRPAATQPGDAAFSSPSLGILRGDLRQAGGMISDLAGVDAVIHLAAGTGGDFSAQFSASVVATEQLLAAMSEAGVRQLVHVSTFSIYDFTSMPSGATLDEASPVEVHPERRDPYAATKLLQEELVWDFASSGRAVAVLRPGLVYGPGRLWDGGVAFGLGRFAISIGPNGRMPLTYVENCADAIVLGLSAPAAGRVVNVVDDSPPTRREYARALRRHALETRPSFPVPYRVASGAVRALDVINRKRWNGAARLPNIAVPASLDARCKPLRYPNQTAKDVLGWSPRFTLDEALAKVAAGSRPG